MAEKRINLVTGGSGFIGGHVVEALIERGEAVRVLDLVAPDNLPEGVDFVTGSITEPADVARAMEGVDTVFHVAGDARLWSTTASGFRTTNQGGTRSVLAGAEKAGVRRFVHTSSITAFVGRQTQAGGTPLTEAAAALVSEEDMLGDYSRSKWLAEREVLAAVERGLDAVIVAPSLPIGPRDRNITPPTRMLLDFLNAKTPAYLECQLNLVDVRDLAEGHVAARDHGRTGERYLLTGENVRMSDFLPLLTELTGLKMPTARVPYGVAVTFSRIEQWISDHISRRSPKAPLEGVLFAGRSPGFDNGKATRELGINWRPARAALAAEIAWLAEEGLAKEGLAPKGAKSAEDKR